MRKRVSIVRTLVDETVNLVLMDELFGPLDAQTRLLLQDELFNLWEGSGRTPVFVTDVVEAIVLADRIAVFSRVPGTIKAVRESVNTLLANLLESASRRNPAPEPFFKQPRGTWITFEE